MKRSRLILVVGLVLLVLDLVCITIPNTVKAIHGAKTKPLEERGRAAGHTAGVLNRLSDFFVTQWWLGPMRPSLNSSQQRGMGTGILGSWWGIEWLKECIRASWENHKRDSTIFLLLVLCQTVIGMGICLVKNALAQQDNNNSTSSEYFSSGDDQDPTVLSMATGERRSAGAALNDDDLHEYVSCNWSQMHLLFNRADASMEDGRDDYMTQGSTLQDMIKQNPNEDQGKYSRMVHIFFGKIDQANLMKFLSDVADIYLNEGTFNTEVMLKVPLP